MSDNDNKPDQAGDGLDDWASALAEQTATAQPATPEPAPEVKSGVNVFQPLTGEGGGAVKTDIDMIMDIPVQLTAELGHTRITIKSLLQLAQGSVVELDGLAGEPVGVVINGSLLAPRGSGVGDEKVGV